jgi:diaminopimelate decarboxylase
VRKRSSIELPLAGILPLTAAVNNEGHLTIAGCDAVEMVQEFGTPLYVFDEETLRHKCREFRSEFRSRHADSGVSYAAKAYLGRALAALLAEEEMDLEVVSGGELAIARSVDFPPQRIYFHGNNKSEEELREALDYGIGRVVVDNPYELELLNRLATALGKCQPILLRLSPNVDPHTHRHTTTGVLDSKFGLPIVTGQAEAAVKQALSLPAVELVGLHFHLGSPIPQMEPYQEAIQVVMAFAAQMSERHGFRLGELSPGGGFAIRYLEDIPAPPMAEYAAAIVSALAEACRAYSLPLPRLVVEPGRAIVGQACLALYKVGASKEVGEAERQRVTIAGKFCESGDVLVRDADLPRLEAGDLLAVAGAGAYCLPMASNYNAFLRPAIVMVKDGTARLIRRRETYEDLMRCDVYLPES